MPVLEVAMHKTLILLAAFLLGCESPKTQNAYSAGNSARNLDVMHQAALVMPVRFVLR